MADNLCDHCGTSLIDKCPVCCAPQCCPKCCAETTRELLESTPKQLTKERIAILKAHMPRWVQTYNPQLPEELITLCDMALRSIELESEAAVLREERDRLQALADTYKTDRDTYVAAYERMFEAGKAQARTIAALEEWAAKAQKQLEARTPTAAGQDARVEADWLFSLGAEQAGDRQGFFRSAGVGPVFVLAFDLDLGCDGWSVMEVGDGQSVDIKQPETQAEFLQLARSLGISVAAVEGEVGK